MDHEWLDAQRARMVREQLGTIGDRRVIDAMAKVPRHLFVPERRRLAAYADSPLSIGFGQTISQPLMVATMLQAAELSSTDRVLDVGAGCGYQAAVLSELVAEVHAIEIVPALVEIAAQNLDRVGADNVEVVLGDGSLGLSEHAPYDAIIVAAAGPRIPDALIEQLKHGGRLIIPVSGRWGYDVLQRVRKWHDRTQVESLCGCRFVPLVMSAS